MQLSFRVAVLLVLASLNALPALAQPPAQPPTGQLITDSLAGPVRKADVLRVFVAGEPNYSFESIRVEDDGTITLPRVGQLYVENSPTARVAQFITERLVKGKYLKRPNVAVYIIGRKAREAVISGAVVIPGRKVLRDGAQLSDILEEANPQPQADLEKVELRRGTEVRTIDYKKFRNGLDNSDKANPPLENGDRIYIRQSEPSEGVVKLFGEVKDIATRPTVAITAGSTVSQILSVAGGLTDYSDRKRIFIQRGSEQIAVPYEAIMAGDRAKDIALRDKDEIHVPRLDKPRQFTVSGGVSTRGAFPLNGRVTAIQAVSLAGPLEAGKRKDVTLMRQDGKGGMLEPRKLNLDNPKDAAIEIQDGDALWVPDPSRNDKFWNINQVVSTLGGLGFLFNIFRR